MVALRGKTHALLTAAVINIGTATLGGFIGAGGYGRPILRGIDKFDVPLMLEGAIPAAVISMVTVGRSWVPLASWISPPLISAK